MNTTLLSTRRYHPDRHRWFLDRICTHILTFEGDSQARLFMGSWSDYERDYHERYGKSVDVPKRVQYRTLKR